MAKSNNMSDKEKDTKTKPKKTKKVEPLEHKDEPLEHKDEPLDNVKVDVEIDLRGYRYSDVVGGYIRRKRLI